MGQMTRSGFLASCTLRSRGSFATAEGVPAPGLLRERGQAELGQVEQAPVDVEEVHESVPPFAARDEWPAQDQGYAHAVFVAALLAHEAVLAQGEAVVTGQDDDGLLHAAGALQGIEDPADLGVQVGDHGVVLGDVAADLGRLARRCSEKLVPDVQGPVVEGVALAEACGRGIAEGSYIPRYRRGMVRGSWGAMNATERKKGESPRYVSRKRTAASAKSSLECLPGTMWSQRRSSVLLQRHGSRTMGARRS